MELTKKDLVDAIREANQIDGFYLAPLRNEIIDRTFTLEAGKEQSFEVIGNHYRIEYAVNPVKVSLNNGEFVSRSQGRSWNAPQGQGYKKITLLSDTAQTVIVSCGLGEIKDGSTDVTVGSVNEVGRVKINGPLDLSELGDNGEMISISHGHKHIHSSQATGAIAYTVPAGKKLYVYEYNWSFNIQANFFGQFGCYHEDPANTWFHRHQDVYSTNSADTYRCGSTQFPIIKENYIDENTDIKNYIQSAGSSNTRTQVVGIHGWLCDK